MVLSYDKLPISAFVWRKDYEGEPSFRTIELWDSFSYHISVIREKIFKKDAEVLCP